MIAAHRPKREHPKAPRVKPLAKKLKVFDETWTARRGDKNFEFVNPACTKRFIIPFRDVYQHIIESPPWKGYEHDPYDAQGEYESFLRHCSVNLVKGGPGRNMKWRWAVKYIIDVLKPSSS
jgi:hypothetical protein